MRRVFGGAAVSVGSLLEYQHEIGQEQETVNGSEQDVRASYRTSALTMKVRIRRMVSTASMQRMIVEPVKNRWQDGRNGQANAGEDRTKK